MRSQRPNANPGRGLRSTSDLQAVKRDFAFLLDIDVAAAEVLRRA